MPISNSEDRDLALTEKMQDSTEHQVLMASSHNPTQAESPDTKVIS